MILNGGQLRVTRCELRVVKLRRTNEEVPLNAKSERVRLKMLKSWNFAGYMWAKLPLGAFSGMRLKQLDDQVCRVTLPGGWRTQNPFRSTYFAAQCMAAEMSTGAPALVLVSG